jgi:hypothetical protein
MAEDGQNDDVMRRILASQRTIIEQNQKILQQQERSLVNERESRIVTQEKIPLILKVKC